MPPKDDLDTLHRDIPKDANGDPAFPSLPPGRHERGWDDDDGHRGIPRDANGDPIFLILPNDMKVSYERKLRSAKAAWLATRDPGALRQAAFFIKHHRQPDPDWYFDAIVTLLTDMRSDKDVQRARNNGVHSLRYQIVRDRIAAAAAAGVKLAVEKASEIADAFKGKHGSPEDMKRSYYKVRRALKQGFGAVFNTIHVPRGQPR